MMKQIGLLVFKWITGIYLVLTLCSNAAQPGVWNAGGGGFNFLYPEDSTAFQKIQMQREQIAIQLYPGLAVVKGTYLMKNHTSDTIRIRVGYPVAGIYDGAHHMQRNEISFDGLYRVKVLQDGAPRPILEEPVSAEQPNTQTFNNDNWYVWESVFLPGKLTEIVVYFMVNTNEAKITEGYASDSHNAFIYILESGRIWRQPIEEATFKVQLMEGLGLEDIYGISPAIDLNQVAQKTVLYGEKRQFTPMPEDNLLINYGQRQRDFNFAARTALSESYFAAVDQLADLSIDQQQLLPYEEKDPYEVRHISTVGWVMGLLFIGLPAALILFVLYRVVRFFRK